MNDVTVFHGNHARYLCSMPPGKRITQVLQSARLLAVRLESNTKEESNHQGRLLPVNFFKRDRTFREPIGKLTTFLMSDFHVGAGVALFVFRWWVLLIALGGM